MPNWCYNDLTLRGDAEEIGRYLDLVSGGDPSASGDLSEWDLTRVHPMPEILHGTTSGFTRNEERAKEWSRLSDVAEAETGHRDWYSWAIANWGTKWAPNVTDAYGDNIRFETAWCPPDELIRRSSEMFPNLTFTMLSNEESQAFVCASVFRGGHLVSEFLVTPHEPPLAEMSDYLVGLWNEYRKRYDENLDDCSEWVQAWCDYECELVSWVEGRALGGVTA